jgi:RNA recognition motif-containing protein
MSRNYSGGKRQREAERERKKKDKAERLRRNRLSPRGPEDVTADMTVEALPAVRLEDVVISVPSQSRKNTAGPVRLFVGGLDSATTVESLRQAFSRFGTLEDAAIIFDRNTGASRGFGFVTFSASTEAAAALGGMNGRELDGRILKVNAAESR